VQYFPFSEASPNRDAGLRRPTLFTIQSTAPKEITGHCGLRADRNEVSSAVYDPVYLDFLHPRRHAVLARFRLSDGLISVEVNLLRPFAFPLSERDRQSRMDGHIDNAVQKPTELFEREPGGEEWTTLCIF
jgi:hypothetical protein